MAPGKSVSEISEASPLVRIRSLLPGLARAEQRVAHLQEWFAEKDYINGLHYLRRKAYDSSIIYFKDVVKNYPNVPATRLAYLRLLEAYQKIRYKDDAADVCNTLRVTYPDDAIVRLRCPAATASAQTPQPPS